MSTRNRTLLAILTVLAFLAATGTADAARDGWSFEILEVPRGADWADFALSRDGRSMGCVLGGSVWWWTAAGGYRFLDEGDPALGGVGISADGLALVAARGGAGGPAPAIWFADGSRVDLGTLAPDCGNDDTPECAFDLSGDGSMAVGLTPDCDRAFVWTRGLGLRSLQGEEGADHQATAVSADGHTVVGWSEHPREGYRRPVLWRDGAGPHPFLGKSRRGEAVNVSPDGRFVVGQAELGGLSPQAFYWRRGSEPVNLGTLRGRATDPSLAHAVSDDGRVVGWSGDPLWGEQEAFVWTAQGGMMSLKNLLRANGVTVPADLVLTSALDISGDGTTVVGVGRDGDWNTRYWRIRLGESLEPTALTGPGRTRAMRPEPVRPDTLDHFQADFLHPFPFGKRRYAPFQ